MERAVIALHGQGASLLIHAGDWTKPGTAARLAALCDSRRIKLRGVLGNNDEARAEQIMQAAKGVVSAEPFLELEVGGLRIAIHHGHRAPLMRQLQEDARYALVVRGHSHRPLIEARPGGLLVNPGSTAFSIPRRKDWQPTAALYDTITRTASLITLPPAPPTVC